MTDKKSLKIGLALGSGAAKGLAHIGIIKVLEENNIPIDFIAGTSIGAMVGGFYAAGLDIKKIEKIAIDTNWRTMFSLIDPNFKSGLFKGEKIKNFIENHIGRKKIEDCRVPFSAVATDFKTGEVVILNKGEMVLAIRSSISIPLLFKPVEMDGRVLVDGGLSVPVPVEIVRNMGADIVIAVNLDKHYYDQKMASGWRDITNDSLNILRHHLAIFCTKEADIIIEMDLGKDWYNFVNGQNKILIGEKEMNKKIPQLRELINQKGKSRLERFFDFLRGN